MKCFRSWHVKQEMTRKWCNKEDSYQKVVLRQRSYEEFHKQVSLSFTLDIHNLPTSSLLYKRLDPSLPVQTVTANDGHIRPPHLPGNGRHGRRLPVVCRDGPQEVRAAGQVRGGGGWRHAQDL